MIPLFYNRGDDGVPERWVEMVRHTLAELGPKVLASRMVRDYTTELYTPAARSVAAISADSFAPARDLAAFRDAAVAAWPSVAVIAVDDQPLDHADELTVPGAPGMRLTAHVELGTLTPEQVLVEVQVGRVDDDGTIVEPREIRMTPLPDVDAAGRARFTTTVTPRRSGRLGYTIRVVPFHEQLSVDAEFGLVRYPTGTADDAGPALSGTSSEPVVST